MHEKLMQSRVAYANIHLKNILPVTFEYIQKQKETNGLGNDFTTYKMLELYEILMDKKPETIVEIGGGITTSVFYEYAKKDDYVWVHSFEEHEEYQQIVKDSVPSLDIMLYYIKPVVRTENECYFDFDWKEKIIKLFDCDFLYVDGPANRVGEEGNYKFLPCTDFERMFEAGIFPDTIVFDMRFQSVEYLMNNSKYGHLYRPFISDLTPIGVPGQYHSIFNLR